MHLGSRTNTDYAYLYGLISFFAWNRTEQCVLWSPFQIHLDFEQKPRIPPLKNGEKLPINSSYSTLYWLSYLCGCCSLCVCPPNTLSMCCLQTNAKQCNIFPFSLRGNWLIATVQARSMSAMCLSGREIFRLHVSECSECRLRGKKFFFHIFTNQQLESEAEPTHTPKSKSDEKTISLARPTITGQNHSTYEICIRYFIYSFVYIGVLRACVCLSLKFCLCADLAASEFGFVSWAQFIHSHGKIWISSVCLVNHSHRVLKLIQRSQLSFLLYVTSLNVWLH